MKVDNVKSNTSFGLKAQTHEFLTSKIAKEIFHLDIETVDLFAKFVQKPDFDEKGLKLFGKDTFNNHFYYPPTTFRPRESHLDFDGKHNAFSKYIDHICGIFTQISNRNKKGVIEEAARAKHFLDDISVGMHVKRGNVIDKYKEQDVHIKFEEYILKKQEALLAKYSPSNLYEHLSPDSDYEDLFAAAVKTSLENEIPNEANKRKWPQIAQKTVNLNIDSSIEFFRLFASLFS